MSLQENVIEEDLMLNFLIDEGIESDAPAKSHCSQKRKAADVECEDNLKEKRSLERDSESANRYRRKRRSKKHLHVHDLGRKAMIPRPNYFVGIQVSNPEIHHAVKRIQEAILRREPALCTAVVPVPTLHITLAVAHLPDIEYIGRAAEVVEKCGSIHREFFNKSASLHFSGLKTFSNEVLFAGIQQSEVLEEVQVMANDLEISFQELTGLPTKKGFKPHLTILKLSKDFKLRRKGMSKISSTLYSDMSDTVFGCQIVRGIQLLSMNKPKDGNGYYYCSHQHAFDVPHSEADDHSECCRKPLSVKPNLENISQLQCIVKHEKDVIKRKFHSLSLASLSSVFGKANEPSCKTDDSDSLLKTLLVVSVATVAIIAAVRGMSSSK